MHETNALLRDILAALRGQQRVVDAAMTPRDYAKVAHATDATEPATREEKVRLRVVDAAMTPRDYVNQYLDDNPQSETRLIDPDFGYRELAAEIGAFFGMDFDHTTVYRAVKKRRKR